MIKNFFSTLFLPDQASLVSYEVRQRRTLQIILAGGIFFAGLLVLITFILSIARPGLISTTVLFAIYMAGGVLIFGSLALWLLGKYVSSQVASVTFIGLTLVSIYFSDTLRNIVLGRTTFAFFIPVILASILLHSWAGYVVAAGISIFLIVGAPIVDDHTASYPVIVALFYFALIVQQTTSILERALDYVQKTNKSLEESEERYRLLVNALPIGVGVHRQGKVIFINPAGAKLMGANDPGQLIGISMMEQVHPDDREKVRQRMQNIVAEGSTGMAEEKFLRLDGSVLEAEVSALRFIFEGQASILTLFTDITQRKQAEVALRESEERFRSLSELSIEGIAIHENGIIRDANQAFMQMMSFSEIGALTGKQGLEVFPIAEASKKALEEHMRSKQYDAYEIALIKPDGTTFPVETQGRNTIYRGRPARVVVMRDITARKKMEESLTRQNLRLQEISRQLVEVQEREKRLLAAELHDDLGQSLTSLKLMLELAASRSPAKREKALGDAHALLIELMGKVRNLSLDLRPAMLDDFGLSAALRWLFERFRHQTDITIHSEIDLPNDPQNGERLDPRIEITAFRIIQEALTNIVRHAGVKEAYIRMRVDDSLYLEIEDHGQGMDTQQIFQYQSGKAGISGMQERARLVNGHVEVQAEKGLGTRIIAEIPLPKGGVV